jgi:hypothetical protein
MTVSGASVRECLSSDPFFGAACPNDASVLRSHVERAARGTPAPSAQATSHQHAYDEHDKDDDESSGAAVEAVQKHLATVRDASGIGMRTPGPVFRNDPRAFG